MKSICLLVFSLGFISIMLQAQELKQFPLNWKRTDYGLSSSREGSSPNLCFLVFEDARCTYSSESAVDTLEHFLKQPPKTRKLGLRFKSYTYLVPLNDAEKKNMTPHLIMRHQDPEWRKDESELVAAMIVECDKRGVPFFVNTSSDLKKPWALLTGAATIEFLKTGKSLSPTVSFGNPSASD